MKRLLFTILAAVAATALADEEPRVSATVLPSTPPPPSMSHGFGGQTVTVRLAIEAPIGSRLDVKTNLIQLAHRLAVPVGEEVPIAEALPFDDQTRQVVEASIPLPEVERVTRFIGPLRVRKAGTDTWETAGETLFAVYPPGQLEPLKRSLAELETRAGLRLGVFGPSEKLRSLLKKEKIPFLDLGVEGPASTDPKVIHLGEIPLEKLRGRLNEDIRLIVFDPEPWRHDRNPEKLPGVYASALGDGFIVEVTLNLLSDIETNPLAQETFARILDQAISQNYQP